MKVSIEVLMLATAAALMASVGYSQSSGDVRGTLSDSTGAVMPDCPIIVKNQDTNQIRRATTTRREFMMYRIWCRARTQ